MASRYGSAALLLLAGVSAGMLASRSSGLFKPAPDLQAASVQSQSISELDWAAAGPGRTEPISGEIRVGSAIAGQLNSILVKPHGKVSQGTLLATVDDSEQLARVRAAEVEVSFREAERDIALSSSTPNERRTAEDNLAIAQQKVRRAQAAYDNLAETKAAANSIAAADAALLALQNQLAEKRRVLETVVASETVPRPTRADSAVEVARAELGIASAALEKTRVRAPRDGIILQLFKTPGEMASAAAEDAILAMGDIERLRVRVEIDEDDLGNVALGQRAVIRCDAFPGQDFHGTVSQIGATARPRAIAARSSVPSTKDNALDVMVELDASAPLVPGMRVDAFFEAVGLIKQKETSDAER